MCIRDRPNKNGVWLYVPIFSWLITWTFLSNLTIYIDVKPVYKGVFLWNSFETVKLKKHLTMTRWMEKNNAAFENGGICVCTHFPLHGAEVLASFHERLSKSSRLYENQGVLSVYLNLDKWTYIHAYVISVIDMICEKGIFSYMK